MNTEPKDLGQWVLVPREPTQEMLDAGITAHPGFLQQIYAAMLSASPTPPAPDGVGDMEVVAWKLPKQNKTFGQTGWTFITRGKNAEDYEPGEFDALQADIASAEPLVRQSDAAALLSSLASENARLKQERDEARHEVWLLGLCVGQIAKWPRFYFNRFYVEEWVLRTAKVLSRWGDREGAVNVLRVTSEKTKPNKRLEKAAHAYFHPQPDTSEGE